MSNQKSCYFPYTRLVPTDIYPVEYGEEQCQSGHAFGPYVRRNYLLHYIYSGEGYFKCNDREYKLHKGQMFLIEPNQLTYYKADDNNPWLYRWLEFNGSMAPGILKAAGLSSASPIYNDRDNFPAGTALLDILQGGDMRFEELMQKLWALIAALTANANGTDSSDPGQEYVSKAESFIKINVHEKLTVTDVAEYIGINRSYLTRLFKLYKNTSPQQYIISLKINTAAHYLKNTGISITEAAQSVGYTDMPVFSKAFKRQLGCSPMQWRRFHK
ncbi:MAG: AraC family ligand binding domain-containing protein [Clostridiales bacterium]|nr:AraC family ligand binding domain-containing protein [Clostridiales bacterium]